MTEAVPALTELDALRAKGVARADPIGWHYIESLAKRTQTHSGLARSLLEKKLHETLQLHEARMNTSSMPQAAPSAADASPSPLATLLQEMGHKGPPATSEQAAARQVINPRIEQFRKQLNKISVQKQVTQALAQAPQNPGPINSHMLVLRSIGLMRDLSPDYLHRFMGYVDTLLLLSALESVKASPSRGMPASQSGR